MRRGDLGDTATDSSSSAAEEFYSPDRPESQTDYSFNYTSIRNPAVASTSRQASTLTTAQKSTARGPKTLSTARKSTARGPKGRGRPQASSSTTASRRKQAKPLSKRQREMRLLREIGKLQTRTDNLVPKLPFARLVREIIHQCSFEVNRITEEALRALQECTELYVTQQLSDAYLLTMHRGRVTLGVKDLELLRLLRLSM